MKYEPVYNKAEVLIGKGYMYDCEDYGRELYVITNGGEEYSVPSSAYEIILNLSSDDSPPSYFRVK